MLILIVNLPSKRRSKIDLHDKRVARAVAFAIARSRNNEAVTPKDCLNDAKTVVSAWVLGQDEQTAAQRLLTWWCLDCGIKTLTLNPGQSNTASAETAERVNSSAKSGYAVLEAVERYGTSWIGAESEHPSFSGGVPKK